MINLKEIISIIVITIILGFITTLVSSTSAFLYTSIIILSILLINFFAKKISSYYLDSEINVRIWQIQRWGFKPKDYFKKPFQIGAFLPIILKIITAGWINWMAVLSFDVKPKVYRTAKRWGTYAFSEMTEYHIGLIAVWGIIVNLITAIIAYFIGIPEFTKLSIFYIAYNLIPLSDLDGNKIFFGSLIWWIFLVVLTLIGLGYALFLV